MNNLKLFKTGAIALILLGILHLLAHTLGKPSDPVLDRLLLEMQNYKISLMGEHNILKFHTGFSIMMGFLISALGIQNFLLAKEILANRMVFASVIMISAIAFMIAIMYFHILAYGFILFSLACSTIAFFRNKS